jgi:hypothetical protein
MGTSASAVSSIAVEAIHSAMAASSVARKPNLSPA